MTQKNGYTSCEIFCSVNKKSSSLFTPIYSKYLFLINTTSSRIAPVTQCKIGKYTVACLTGRLPDHLRCQGFLTGSIFSKGVVSNQQLQVFFTFDNLWHGQLQHQGDPPNTSAMCKNITILSSTSPLQLGIFSFNFTR